MRGRVASLAGALLAGLLAACQTETRTFGDGAPDAAARGGWGVRGGTPAEPVEEQAPPERPPGEYVEVPVEAYRPVDLFFDNEGYLLGDRIEIDCSYNPFMARMATLSYDHSAAFVVREEWQQGDVYHVRLKNAAPGAAYQQNLIPMVTFGTQRLPPPPPMDPVTGKPLPVAAPTPRPFFEIVGTQEILLRFHMTSSPDRPVWFQVRATGSPDPARPAATHESIYVNANRRRRVKGDALALRLEIRRGEDGRWSSVVEDPAPAAGGTGGR